MIKKIAILGSTGSIGRSLLKIVSKDKTSFKIKLLTANKNYKKLLKQAKLFNVKNVILTDKKTYLLSKKYFKKNKISVFNDYSNLNKILKNKIDYVMSSIVGLDGLDPTLKIIKFTKNIAIANKESIICAWHLIKKNLIKFDTKFIPVDSEHYSIWHALNQDVDTKNVKKIYLTASGGPLLNISKKKFNRLDISKITKHPNWRMGKKISVDSSNLMNKVFEIIEAKKIFDVNYEQLDILIHPNSYIHTIIQFKNKMITIIAHNTTMDIPISNTLVNNIDINHRNKDTSYGVNLKKLNKLSLNKVDNKKFPLVNLLKLLPKKETLFETVLVSTNDQLVNLYLSGKIKYTDISKFLFKIINLKEMKKFKKINPKKLSDIFKVNKFVKSKINSIIA